MRHRRAPRACSAKRDNRHLWFFLRPLRLKGTMAWAKGPLDQLLDSVRTPIWEAADPREFLAPSPSAHPAIPLLTMVRREQWDPRSGGNRAVTPLLP